MKRGSWCDVTYSLLPGVARFALLASKLGRNLAKGTRKFQFCVWGKWYITRAFHFVAFEAITTIDLGENLRQLPAER